ncbi:flagellar motor protein PomA [Aestuariirhabdus litorea]|uniref:Flagellar motor protein PomA n=1 Tax=Aestuariirhabdus litorea TaxID=2528527 RepID=A0A3P3VPP3_9GAMM|nr:flagellar motor protein PomA [Aestuariirhabdus litorea]RRJ83609.1 flagellar motor protein PomA [Aestuariirhabdus litorea]RWW96830.1 flagellar motor protein PomA [Endozoicomonadaceae bacterium GTF-13]
MDLATLVGLLGAFCIVISAIIFGGSAGVFFNIPSILIVVIGTIFTVLMKFTLKQFFGAFRVAGKSFKFKSSDLNSLIDEIVELADIARKGGLLALEEKEPSHPFLKQGIQLLVDGHDPAVVKAMLTKDMRLAVSRHESGAKIFSAMGDVAPAMGMIGTLVGLVQMLANMSDPKSIGPAMAVALLTTLYGAMIATMFALPMADKLALRRDEEALTQALIIDALLAIQEGQNPRVIASMLRNYLPTSAREVEEAG